jgi:hypothetical protein
MADKSQMDTFYKECLRFGCLEVPTWACRGPLPHRLRSPPANPEGEIAPQGFKHFSLYLRGREELVVTVHHEGVSETPVDSRKCAPCRIVGRPRCSLLAVRG